MPSAAPVLQAQGITLTRGSHRILDGVALDLHLGETVALLGPNGAGKSSLLAVLAGLTAPTSGRVAVDGRVAAALQSASLADRSALANVELALDWWGAAGRARGTRADRRARAETALAVAGAAHLAARPARELSGGEARRVHLARSLAVEPDVLLLDEPFAGLDASTRADLLGDSVAALRSERRATLIVVHDRAEAWALADRVLVLMAGRIVADGSVREVLETPPSEVVAEFVGFTGRLDRGDSVLRLRAGDVSLVGSTPGGAPPGAADVCGTVTRRVPSEDGVRCQITVDGGEVSAIAEHPGPAVGERVGLSLLGGISYPVTASRSPLLRTP